MLEREIHSCFVTGGTGFIGGHLVEHLTGRGWKVRALVRNPAKAALLSGLPVNLVEGDLFSHEVLREACSGVDAVFHVAGAITAPSREGYHRVNKEGARILAEAALSAEKPPRVFIFVSSMAAAGPSGARGAAREVWEEDEPAPITDYGRSKLAGEKALLGLAGLPLVIVRPPAVYGPRDRGLLPLFRLAGRGLFPAFNRQASLSLVHVVDLVRGIVLAAGRGRFGQAYFMAHPHPVRTEEMPVLMARALGRERLLSLPVPFPLLWGAAALNELAGRLAGRMPVFNRQKAVELAAPGWVCATAKAHGDLGFTAEIGIEVGLVQTALWYREQGWV